jgi:hypothetical protein
MAAETSLFYDLEIEAALSLVEAMDSIMGGCANPHLDGGCDCGGCLFNLSRFKRAGGDSLDWRMILALDDWRTPLRRKQARKEDVNGGKL